MEAPAKLLTAVMLFILVAAAGWIYQSAPYPAIEVSVQTVPDMIKNGDKAKIVLKAEANGRALSHGDVLLGFWPLDWKAAEGQSTRIAGCTDANGLFLTSWQPPCTGRFMIAAEVWKSGHLSRRKTCYLQVSE